MVSVEEQYGASKMCEEKNSSFKKTYGFGMRFSPSAMKLSPCCSEIFACSFYDYGTR